MVINLVIVAGSVVLGLIGDPTTQQSRTQASRTQASRTDEGGAPAVKMAARVDSFSPPPRAKKRKPAPARPPGAGQAEPSVEEEVDEDQPRRPPPAAARRRPAVEEMESEAGVDSEDEEEDEDRPKKKKRKKVEEEEEEDEEDDAPMASLPVILPRIVSLNAGVSAIGRNFAYDSALQQKESTFPRPGVGLTVEAYPMLRMPRGWHRKLGVGFTLAMEFGAAALASGGFSTSAPVSQRRWSLDVRYAIPAGERVVLIPVVGYGSNTFDLKSPTPVAPSLCGSGSTTPCIADIQATHAVLGAHIRIAVTETISVSLSGAYFLGLAVGKGPGQIGVESTQTKLSGFHVEPGANFMLKDWLAVRVAVPYSQYAYAFTSQMATYKSAKETYYGGTLAAVLFMQ